MTQSFHIVIVEKTGTIKSVLVKDLKDEDLFKKCGFKKGDDFTRQIEWSIKHSGEKYFVSVYAKTDGRANSENKYDFPPPIDTKLFFGNCAIVAKLKKDDTFEYTNLTVELWEKFYEKLFGGFEDLTLTCADDEEEEDELANVPKDKKTKKGGYLKDGFVVDSDSTDEDDYDTADDDDTNEDETEESDDTGEICENGDTEDFTCELVEEEYDYDEAQVNTNCGSDNISE
jgi:hypothetical protein